MLDGTQNIMALLASAGPVVKSVLIVLFLMSVISWAIIYTKLRLLRSSSKKSRAFLDLYHSNENMKTLLSFSKEVGGPVAELFRAGYTEVAKIEKKKNRGESDSGGKRRFLSLGIGGSCGKSS